MLLTWLCVLDAALLVAGLLLAVRHRCRDLGREVAIWTTFGVVTAGAFWLAATALTPNRFALLRAACHALFCVFLPVLAVRGAVVARTLPAAGTAVLVLALFGEGCYLWARRVEPFRLEVTRERITSRRLPAQDRPLRLAAVADLQPDSIGPFEIGVFDALVAAEPDVVVFLGDYIQQFDRREFLAQRAQLHAQLARLQPPLGMYAVDGDVDGFGIDEVFAGTAVRSLVDATVALPGLPIDVIGLSRARGRRPAIDAGLVRQLRGERFPIVIAHAPDYMRCVLDGGLEADALFLAGHTHGGQVQVPFFGPLITLSSVPRWLAGGGVFRRGETWLAVSRGIGMERDKAPRIRFWCRPQLLLLELANEP